MTLIILLLIPFVTGAVIRLRGIKETRSWFLSSLVLPVIAIFDEFVLPYRGGGTSMWPIALVMGGFYGVISGGLGVAAASFYLKKRANTQQKNRYRLSKNRAGGSFPEPLTPDEGRKNDTGDISTRIWISAIPAGDEQVLGCRNVQARPSEWRVCVEV